MDDVLSNGLCFLILHDVLLFFGDQEKKEYAGPRIVVPFNQSNEWCIPYNTLPCMSHTLECGCVWLPKNGVSLRCSSMQYHAILLDADWFYSDLLHVSPSIARECLGASWNHLGHGWVVEDTSKIQSWILKLFIYCLVKITLAGGYIYIYIWYAIPHFQTVQPYLP